MAKRTRRTSAFRPDKLVEFLEATYDFASDDQSWVVAVAESSCAVFGRDRAVHGATYDASDVASFRLLEPHIGGLTEEGTNAIMEGLRLLTPAMVTRSFRSKLISLSDIAFPEMQPMYERLGRLGFIDTLYLNGLDPGGRGVMMGLWSRERLAPPPAEMAVYRRMAHHLGAAYRCRRKLRAAQSDRPAIDVTEGAAAVLDARKRIVHAEGPATAKEAQRELIESSIAREHAWTRRDEAPEGLRRWRALTAARWTLVDSFERDGQRYIVARENPSNVPGLAALSERERQVVAYAAIGQSTKETAYALGISDTTVRVLLSRAATKLGVRSRDQLLDHPEVQALKPGTECAGRDEPDA